jgi:hypothetical protein
MLVLALINFILAYGGYTGIIAVIIDAIGVYCAYLTFLWGALGILTFGGTLTYDLGRNFYAVYKKSRWGAAVKGLKSDVGIIGPAMLSGALSRR